LAVIKNIIQTQFTSTGADKVNKDTDRINRSQTRLGQSSASAGRAFAAQSQGLGGLVAAYAGAAATIFALQQAFSALSKAAQSDAIIQGTKTLAAEIGQSGPRILKSIKDITEGQVTLTEAAQNANIALSAGFNTRQIEGFTTVALKASRALGRDFTDSLQRITRGVAKLEPELLDELGIFTRIEPAVQKYARQLGVSANSLNEFQRRQAFANAAIEEGLRKFGAIDTTAPSTQKSLEQLRVQVEELGIALAKLLVNVLLPIVNFFKNDFGNTLLLFGGILTLVFSKGSQVVGGFVNDSLKDLTKLSEFLADKNKFDVSALSNLRETVGQKREKGGYIIRATPLKGQDAEQAKRFKEALDLQRGGAIQTISQLNKVNLAYKEQQKFLEATKKTGSQSYQALTAAISANSLALEKADVKSRAFIGTANLLRGAASGLTIAFSLLSKTLGVIGLVVTAAQLALQLFGIDAIGWLTEKISKLFEASKNLETGFTGAAAAAAGGSAKLTESLKALGATAEDLEKLPDSLKTLRKEIEDTAESNALRASGFIENFGTVADQVAAEIDLLGAANEKIAELNATIAETTDPAQLDGLRQQLTLVTAIADAYKKYGAEYYLVIGELAAQTGLSAEKVATSITDTTLGVIQKSSERFAVFGQQVQKLGEDFSLAGLNAEQRRLVEAGILSVSTINDLNEAIKAGSINSQQLGSSIGGLESQLQIANEAFVKQNALLRDSTALAQMSDEEILKIKSANIQLSTSINSILDEIRVFKEIESSLLALEKTYKGITSTFSKEIGLIDTAPFQGIIDIEGKIVTNQQEQIANQNELIETTLLRTAESAKLIGNEQAINALVKERQLNFDDERKLRATINAEAELYNKTLQAAIGRFVDQTIAAANLTEELRKQTQELRNQNAIAQLSNRLQNQQALAQRASLESTFSQNRLSANIAKLQAQQALEQAKASKGGVSAAKQQLEIQQSQLQTARELSRIELGIAQTRAQARVEEAKITREAFAEDDLFGIAALAEVFRAEKELFQLQKAEAEVNYSRELELIAVEKQIAEQNLKSSGASIAAIERQLELELQIFDEQAKLEKAKLDASADELRRQREILETQKTIQRAEANTQKAALEAQIAKIRSDNSYLTNLQTLNNEFLKGYSDVIRQALTAQGVDASLVKKVDYKPDTKVFTEALAEITKLESAMINLYGPEGTVFKGIEQAFEIQSGNISAQISDLQKQRTELDALNDIRRQTIQAQAEAEKAGGQEKIAEYQKTLNELQVREAQANAEILKAREELARKEADLILNLVKEITKTISSVVTSSKQAGVNRLLQEEALLKNILESQTQDLTDVQNKYSEALEKEISLREKVTSATESLLASQQSYFDSLVGANAQDIRSAGTNYLKQLQEQQQATLELSRASGQRAATEQSLASLTQSQAVLQASLQKVTTERIAKEEELAEIQKVLGAITDIANGKLKAFVKTIASLASLGGSGGIQNLFSMDTLKNVFFEVTGINDLKRSFGEFAKSSVGLQNAGASLAKSSTQLASTAETLSASAVGSAAGTVAGTTAGTTTAAVPAASMSTFASVALSAIQGAFIGNFIGKLTGDTSLASTIGGAIGFGVATLFKGTAFVAKVSAAISTTVGSTAIAAFATPLIFAAIGALIIGALFGKRPKPTADVKGKITGEGYQGLETVSRDLSAENVAAIEDIPTQVFGNLITGLKSAGIRLADEIDVQVRFYKGNFEKVGLAFKSGFKALENVGKEAQAVSDELVKQFFQGVTIQRNDAGAVTFRSLVVDALTPNAADLQQALDVFAEIQDINQKTQERFLAGLEFAQEFSATLAKITANVPNIANIYAEIDRVAAANASNVSAYYNQLREETVKYFGESSDQTDRLVTSFKQYALASVGVIESSRGMFENLQDVSKELNAGAIAVRNVVARVRAMSSVFTELGMTAGETAAAIRAGINAEIGNLISASAEALRDAVEAFELGPELKNLKNVIEGGTQAVKDWKGIITELNAVPEIEPGRIAEANQALQDAIKVNEYAIQESILTLTKEQLKAVIAADGYGSAIAETAAEQRLAILREQDRTKALQQFAKATRNFAAGLERINSSIIATVGIGAVPLQDLMTAMNDAKFGNAAQSINSYLQSITRGENIVDNFKDAIDTLNNEFGDNEDKIMEFAQSLDVLQDATIQTIDIVYDLVVAYEDTVRQISDAFNQSKDAVLSTIKDLGSEIISLTSNISDQTSEILGIYDDTLATVAESGNELYDLRDTAKDAFEVAAKAVKEFEKTNKLSGKSSSLLRQEISAVEAEIASLVSAENLDFSGFLQLSDLTSKQSALKRELSSVVDVEAEYEQLLGDRTQAIEDLAFVEASIASLTGSLIDTRRKESDIIKKTQDAVVTFNQAQNDLQDITELLAESNFNLNQVRTDEESVVNKVREALSSYNKDLEALTVNLEAIGGESGAALRSAFIQAAAGNAEIIFATLEEAAREAKIEEAIANASAAFTQLQALAAQVEEFFTPVETVFDGLEEISVGLTDNFRNFNEDLVKYLDVDGLSQFYGEGGIFSQFRESLLSTLKTDGFDILTAPGGPLDNFNVNLGLITGALTTLTEAGNILDVSIQTATTSFGTFVAAVGTDLDRLTAGYVGLATVGQNLSDTAPENLNLYAEGIGNINAVLEEGGSLSVLFEASDALTSLYTSVDVIDSLLNEINFEVSAQTAKDQIVSAVNVINSTLNDVSLSISAAGTANNITASINTIDSTLKSVDLGVAATEAVDAITLAVNTLNSTIEEVDLSAAADNMVKVINAAVNLLDSTISNVDLSISAETMIENVESSIQEVKDTLGGVVLETSTAIAIGAINASVDSVNSALDSVDFSVKTGEAQAAIASIDTTLNNSLAGVSFTTNLEEAAADIANIQNTLNSTLGDYEVQTKLTEATDKLEAVKTQLNAKLNSYDFSNALTGATTLVDGIDDALNNSLNSLNVNTATSVFDSLVEAISGTSTDNVKKFSEAIFAFSDLTTEISNTNGLATALSELAAENSNVSALTDRFSTLKSEIDRLTGNTGVQALKDTLSTISTDLADAWDNIRLNTAAIKITAQTGPISVSTSGGITSSQADDLVKYAKKYPKIEGVPYSANSGTLTLAEGGPVKGPGNATSDSIPAQLSNGEYVIRAATVSKLGQDFLNTLNTTGSLDSALSMLGRNGDTNVAHLTKKEMDHLKKLGGSGSRNPKTGLFEFFNKDAGALGRFFAKQEADLLWNTYGSKMLADSSGIKSYSIGRYGEKRQGMPEIYDISATTPFAVSDQETMDLDVSSWQTVGENALFSPADRGSLKTSQAAALLLANEMLVARKSSPLKGIRSKYAQGKKNIDYANRNFIDANLGKGYPGSSEGHWAPAWNQNLAVHPNIGYNPGYTDVGKVDVSSKNGGWAARFAQALSGSVSKVLNSSSTYSLGTMISKDVIRDSIDKLNEAYPNFTDFYMLNKTKGKMPALTSSGKNPMDKIKELSALDNSGSSGDSDSDNYVGSNNVYLGPSVVDSAGRGYGSVYGDPNTWAGPTYVDSFHGWSTGGAVKGRDSIPGMLEPGEFVLRKAAVERMGLDSAYKLNATGDMGGETNVEVNITNNGTPVNVSGSPQIRRENGKLVLDIILEDIRNNGPIRQQIRSIR